MATEIVPSNPRKPIDEASCMLHEINATVDLLAESMADEGGQAAANPKQVCAILYGVLRNLETVKDLVDSFELPPAHKG